MTTESVVVLFTDVVGSTELAARLSPDRADEIRREHFSTLRQAIAEGGGTEIKNLGDGVMVVFASASAALACAVAMQQGVELDNRRGEHAVGLRVGLSGGELTREDDDYFGDPVIEAARLCAQCERGQILSADVVRAMAGRRSRHTSRAIGPLALKGLAEPVDTFEVLWEPLRGQIGAAVPLPNRLSGRPGVGVVGRSTELAVIVDAIKRVSGDGSREILLLSGEAGLGKTTLVAEAARIAYDQGACVLFGHCEEDLATPYQLFSEALGHYVTHAEEDDLVAHVAEHNSELARLVPVLRSRLPALPAPKASDAETERYLLFAAVVGLVSAASQVQTVVIVLDDLQWADKASLQLLRHLAASETPMRLLVVGTYRDLELSLSHPLLDTLAALRRREGVMRLDLTGLDDAGVVSFLEAAAGATLDERGVGLAHAVYRETDGNPFFVSEVLRHLTETGAIYQDEAGRWTAADRLEDTGLPDSLREVIGARVGRLGTNAERVLSLAAVIGRDFDLDLLALAAESSEDDVLDVLDAAVAAALVRELRDSPGRYSFAHALIQRTLYEDLGPTRRARAHRQVAEALEDLSEGQPDMRVGELARHWFRATQPKDVTKALTYSRRAADAALASLAPGDALRYYGQALDLYEELDEADPLLEIDLGIGLGTAQRQTGEAASRDTLLAAARLAAAHGDTDRLVAAALANDRGSASQAGVVDDEQVEILTIALDRLPADHPNRALVLAHLCQELTFGSSLERRKALAEEACALASASGDDATIVHVLDHVAQPLLVPEMLEQSQVWSADALERADRLGDPTLMFWAAVHRLQTSACAGDVDELDRCLERLAALADRLDQPNQRWSQILHSTSRALLAGDVDRAEQLAESGLAIATESGQPDAFPVYGAQLMLVAWQRGTMGELVPLIEQVADENPGIPGFRGELAKAYVESDDLDSARRVLGEFADVGFDLPVDPIWLTGMACFAEAAIACGDPRFAEPLLDRLAPWGDQLAHNDATTMGPVHRFLGGLSGVLGRHDEAEAHFGRAAEFCGRFDARFFGALTDLSWGAMLLDRRGAGDIDRAGDLLTAARDTAAANGYQRVERRAAELLSQ